MVYYLHIGSCLGQTVRLVNGSDENEGRVEVCSNGVWGTVYGGYGWDSRGGIVVCRQLGFLNPGSVITFFISACELWLTMYDA